MRTPRTPVLHFRRQREDTIKFLASFFAFLGHSWSFTAFSQRFSIVRDVFVDRILVFHLPFARDGYDLGSEPRLTAWWRTTPRICTCGFYDAFSPTDPAVISKSVLSMSFLRKILVLDFILHYPKALICFRLMYKLLLDSDFYLVLVQSNLLFAYPWI